MNPGESHKKISLFITALAFFLVLIASTYHLSESPGIWFDEGMYTQTALNFEKYGVQTLQVAPGEFVSAGSVTGGFPFIAPVALSYKLFGAGVIQGRVVMVIFIFAFAIASFFFIRNIFGVWYGSWAFLLLSSFAMLYGNGKSVLGEIPGLFFLICACLGLVFLERKGYRSVGASVTVGLFAGLCVATKPIFILLLPALALAWLFRFREVRIRIRDFFFGSLAFIFPLGVWLYFQFGTGDTLSELLLFYTNPYSIPDLPALVGANIHRFFTDTTALYTLILLVIWSVALFLRRKKAERVSIAELVVFFFSLIIITASLRLPGWNRYIFPATTLALLFFPHSSVYIYNCIRSKLPVALRKEWIPYALLLLMFFGQMYQVGFSSYVANYYHAHRTKDLQEAFASLKPSAPFFVYNVPEVVIFLPSQNYYQYIKPHENDDEEVMGVEQLSHLEKGTADYVLTGKGDFERNPTLFARYRVKQEVNRYAILEHL